MTKIAKTVPQKNCSKFPAQCNINQFLWYDYDSYYGASMIKARAKSKPMIMTAMPAVPSKIH